MVFGESWKVRTLSGVKTTCPWRPIFFYRFGLCNTVRVVWPRAVNCGAYENLLVSVFDSFVTQESLAWDSARCEVTALSLEAVIVSIPMHPQRTVLRNLTLWQPALLQVRTSRVTEEPCILLHKEMEIQTAGTGKGRWRMTGVQQTSTMRSHHAFQEAPGISRGENKNDHRKILEEEGSTGHWGIVTHCGPDRRHSGLDFSRKLSYLEISILNTELF